KDHFRINRIDDDACDSPSLVQAHVRPCLTRVHGAIDAVAAHITVADGPSFAGTGPHDGGIGGRNRQCTDRLYRLVVEDGLPTIAAVHGVPHATGGRAGIVRVRVAGDAGDRGDAISDYRTDVKRASEVAGCGPP